MLTEFTGGSSAITSFDVATGQSERLWQGDENLHAGGNYPNFSLARDGFTAAAIRQDWQHPPEIWAGRIGEWRSDHGGKLRAATAMGPGRKYHLVE